MMSPGATDYVHRVVDTELDALVPVLPAIALEGAKAVGKGCIPAPGGSSESACARWLWLSVVEPSRR